MTTTPVNQVGLHYRSIATLTLLSAVAAGFGWKLLSRTGPRDIMMAIQTDSDPHAANRHPVYWFDDGSVIVRASDSPVDGQSNTALFKIHEPLLRRHSQRVLEPRVEEGWGIPVVTIPGALGVRVQDFISLLAHLYHDIPLSLDAPFPHVAAILRASSSEQLDLPSVHRLARSYLVAMFPSGPFPFVHPEPLNEALYLALRYNITSIQKGIYYSLVTGTDFELGSDATAAREGGQRHVGVVSTATTIRPVLTHTDLERCRRLLDDIIAHFTPVLFEPPVTIHMKCSSLLADRWYPLVVQSAIAENSVCKPLEALERVKSIDWEAEGLCATCVQERREAWTNAQKEVWEKMDGWLASDGEASE